METERIRLKTFVAACATVVCLEIVTRWVSAGFAAHSLFLTGIARIAAIAVLLALTLKMQSGLGSIGLASGKTFTGLRRGALWSIAFACLAAIALIALHLAGIDPLKLFRVPLPEAPLEVLSYFLVGAGLAPIAEEIFFRGVVYGYLRRWGPAVAVAGSTLLFVAAHPNLHQLPIAQLVGGVVFAVAYEVEKNLMVPIVIHAAGNFALFGLSLIH